MYEKGLVSVVIPTYKRSTMLTRAIRSVVNQTYKNIEILVVDDNEPGDEYSIAAKDLINNLNYSQVRLVTQPKHINGAAARNAGIREAKGEYICFLDDDDLYMPNKIERQLEELSKKSNEVGGVSCLKIFFKGDKLTHISESWKPSKTQSFDVMSKELNIQTGTVLLRRECLDKAGYFDPNLRRHQEVQLMSYFTDKYRIDLIEEILTIIDGSDLTNRPDYDKLKGFKDDFFKSVEPLLSKYSKADRRFVINNHRTELAWVMYRDISKVKGLLMLLQCFTSWRVVKSFFNRYVGKKKDYNRINNYPNKDYILSLIKS